MNLKYAYIFGLIGMILTFSLLAMGVFTSPAYANSETSSMQARANKTPSPTPVVVDPKATASLDEIATQQVQIDTLQRDLERHEAKIDFELRDIRWQVDRKLYVAGAIGIILGFLGYRTYRQIDETLREKISTTLSKELYRLDPTMLTIRIRRGRDLEREYRRMELSGLENLAWYSDFSKECVRGVTIVPIDSDADEKEFLIFLNAYDLDPSEAAFILYARERKVSTKVINSYENLTIANNPTSLAGAILVVGRGLTA